jgi:methylase of polypeptide subunit release factors
VQLARANVRRHGLGDRVTVLEGDLLDPIPGRVDVIVANLPYLSIVDAELYADLEREPAAAVFAPGDGLDHYRRLVEVAHERLMPEGALIIQLHRRVLVAERGDLELLAAELTEETPPAARRRKVGAGRGSR